MERTEKKPPIIVHKAGHEGTIELDAMTGAIQTRPEDRPAWAEGLAVALLPERHKFYATRLGEKSEQFKHLIEAPNGIDVQDLGWVGVNGEEQEVEIEASDEFRMDAIATILGVNRDEGTMGDDVVAEREVDSQKQTMTAEQKGAFEFAQMQGFKSKAGEQEQKQAASK